jgi:phage shock protein B
MAGIIGSLSGLLFASIPIVWIVMHYRSKQAGSKGLTDEEGRQIAELLRVTDSMAERIKTLEALLDAEYPDWREHDKD